MQLSSVQDDPVGALLRMERYVNKGSPSGFTDKYTVSERYRPRSLYPQYDLPQFLFPRSAVYVFNDDKLQGYSEQMVNKDTVLFPVHPDMVKLFSTKHRITDFSVAQIHSTLDVVPTANARTVFRASPARHYYIKLAYHGIIGRIDRALPLQKAIAGPEITNFLIRDAVTHPFPKTFAILPEDVALVKGTSNNAVPEVGVVLRDSTAYPRSVGGPLFPFFSLFSKDSMFPEDPPLLLQLLERFASPLDVFRTLVEMLLTAYTYLVFDLGFLPELNAQNVLLETDTEAITRRIVLRDLQGWEKDITIRRSRGLPCDFNSAPYKCIDSSQGEIYFIRHSFSYDFKLGEYILEELVNLLHNHYAYERGLLRGIAAKLFRQLASGPRRRSLPA